MFESVVVDVLNRFLGDYVVNLDTSQLTLGIWGGNETVAGSQSCLPPGLPLRERGPTLLGPRGPGWSGVSTCHRPPGSNYVKPGDSSRPSPARCLFLAGGAGGVGAGGERPSFFEPCGRGPRSWTVWVWSSDSSPRGPAAAVLGAGRQPGAPVLGLHPCHCPLGL